MNERNLNLNEISGKFTEEQQKEGKYCFVKEKKMDYKNMFPHIAGYDKIKEEGSQIIDMLSNSEEYTKRGAYIPRGWFFYGEPGMGKTQIVKDISAYLNYPMIEISSTDAIRRKYSIEEDIVNGFEKAKSLGKCIVFIDELDKIAGYRKPFYDMPENLNVQKVLIPILDDIKKHNGIVVIATANKSDYLNDTILRNGRFDRQILFEKPNVKDRKEIMEFFINGAELDKDVDIEELVQLTAGFSCAEIEFIVNEAKISSVLKRKDDISFNDFNDAIRRIRYKDIPKDHNNSEEQNRLRAYHEAGHALMGYHLQPDRIVNVTIIAQGESGGSLNLKSNNDNVMNQTYFEQSIRIGLAGMISTKILSGEFAGGNIGDLNKVVNIIKTMMNNGMCGIDNIDIFVSNEERDFFQNRYVEHDNRRCNTIISVLKEASKDVEQYLSDNKETLMRIADALVENKTLTVKQLINIIEQKGDINESDVA